MIVAKVWPLAARLTGKSIVYAPTADTSLEKAHVDGTPTQNVTPISSSTYYQCRARI